MIKKPYEIEINDLIDDFVRIMERVRYSKFRFAMEIIRTVSALIMMWWIFK